MLILDEPTSSLADDEVASLFAAIRSLKGRVATVFVSHRLKEFFELVDRVTVLRDGEVVGEGQIGDFDEPRLVHLMVGRELEELEPDYRRHEVEDAVLRVRDFSVPGRFESVSFDVGPERSSGSPGSSARAERSPRRPVRARAGGHGQGRSTSRRPRTRARRCGRRSASSPPTGSSSARARHERAREHLHCPDGAPRRLARPAGPSEQEAVAQAVRDFRIVTAPDR